MKTTKPKIKIFEADILKDAYLNCLKEGYRPANIKEINLLLRNKKIPHQWYDTGNVYDGLKIRKFIKSDITKKGVHVLYLGLYSVDLSNSINDGRVVGILKTKRGKKYK
jgi:hypothetical protein